MKNLNIENLHRKQNKNEHRNLEQANTQGKDTEERKSQVENSLKNKEKIKVFKSIHENREYLEQVLKCGDDVVFRESEIKNISTKILLVYISTLVDKNIVLDEILRPLSENINKIHSSEELSKGIIFKKIEAPNVSIFHSFDDILMALLSGETLLFVDEFQFAISIQSMNSERRNVEKPETEQTIRGPRESFIEDVQTNIGLIRRRIRDPRLSVELFKMGKITNIDVALVYLDGIIEDEVLSEIREKLKKIDVDSVIASAQVEDLITSHSYSVFPQILATERPDRVVGGILEGRAAIIVNGTPFTLIAPTSFSMFFSSPDDYYGRTITSSFLRIIRYISFFLSTSLEAIYISLTAYHPGLIPTSLALSITGTRVGLPFPELIEIMIMELALYIIQEAAVRLPKPIGQTIGIIGGVVIGQASVLAGLLL